MMTTKTHDRAFTLTRILHAPRSLVYQAWTDPNHLQWFFNDRMPTDDPIEVDLRVGGAWRQTMVIDDTTAYVTGGVYREIVPGEKLVFAWGAVGGWPGIDPEHPEDSAEVTLTLTDAGDRGQWTEMTFTLRLPAHFADDRVRELLATGMREGWSQTLERLVTRFDGDTADEATRPENR